MTGAGKDTLVKGKRSCTVLFFSAYFIYYAVYCVFSSFIVLFLTEQGYSATVCGIITSLTFLANLLMEPVGGYITDTFLPTRRYLLVCIGIVSMVCAFCTKFMNQSWLLLPGLVLAAGLAYPFSQLMDAWVNLSKESYPGLIYSRIRAGGSIGFAVMSVIGGFYFKHWGWNRYFQMQILLFLMMIPFLILLPDTRLGNHRKLAKQYNVSRITVRRAVDDLVSQGLVEKKQGKGTFICRQKFAKDIKNLQSFSEMCRHMNMKPGGQMLENKLVLADDKIQKQLNLEPGSYVVYISRLRTADGEPVAIEKNYFPVKYSFLLEKQFNDNSLFECLQEEAKVRVASSEKRIELCRATAEEAKLMKVKKGTPLLYIKSVTYTYDREPLYAGVQLFNGETCSFYVCESIEQ